MNAKQEKGQPMTGIFDPKKAKLSVTCQVPGALFGLCQDPGANKLYGAGTDWAVHSVDLNADKPSARKEWTHHDNYVAALAWLDGVVISGGYDRRLVWTEASTGKKVRAIQAHEGWLRDLALFPDGKRLASVGDDMLVKVWEAETGKNLLTLEGHRKQTPQGYATALYTVAISPDGKVLASGDRIGEVCLWEVDTGKLRHRLSAPQFYTYDPVKRVRSIGGIRSLAFSPDGAELAIAGIGQVTNVDGFVGPCRVEVWDWRAGKRLFAGQDKHKAVLNHVAFHPSEPWLIAAGGGDSGGLLTFWDRKSTAPSHQVKVKGHLHRFLIDGSGTRLFAVGFDGFQIWICSG
jgi:WD40 repeat protein